MTQRAWLQGFYLWYGGNRKGASNGAYEVPKRLEYKIDPMTAEGLKAAHHLRPLIKAPPDRVGICTANRLGGWSFGTELVSNGTLTVAGPEGRFGSTPEDRRWWLRAWGEVFGHVMLKKSVRQASFPAVHKFIWKFSGCERGAAPRRPPICRRFDRSD
jgi:hypothetical protein